MFHRRLGSFHVSLLAALCGSVPIGPPVSKPIKLPELPVGKAPEELRQPLLKGRRGKKSRRERKKK